MRNSIVAAVTAIAWACGPASAQTSSLPVYGGGQTKGSQFNGQFEATETLKMPLTAAAKQKGRDGELVFMSANGRFVIRGELIDLWNNAQTISSLSELRSAQDFVQPAMFDNISDDDVRPLVIGEGNKVVHAFVDPLCEHCLILFDQVRDNPELTKSYTFKFYLIDVTGDASTKAVAALSCAADQGAAARALIEADQTFIADNLTPNDCDPSPLLHRRIMGQVLGVSGFPYIFNPEGRVSAGMPRDLSGFLAMDN